MATGGGLANHSMWHGGVSINSSLPSRLTKMGIRSSLWLCDLEFLGLGEQTEATSGPVELSERLRTEHRSVTPRPGVRGHSAGARMNGWIRPMFRDHSDRSCMSRSLPTELQGAFLG